jgi:hypothetical protein
LPFLPQEVFVKPIFSGAARLNKNSVVSCSTRIGPSVARTRNPEAAK